MSSPLASVRPPTCDACPHRSGSGWPEDPYVCEHEDAEGRRVGTDGDPPPEWCPLPVPATCGA